MRHLALLSFVLIVGCDEPEENLDGQLVRVEVQDVTLGPGCTPARFSGDAGIQFFAERPDGGLVFTMGEQAQYGPTRDGGVLPGATRQVVPAFDFGRVRVGEGDRCVGTLNRWERVAGGLRLQQDWPGGDDCPTGPSWLPPLACSTTRLFNFTEVGTCQQRCVRITSSSGEVECSC